VENIHKVFGMKCGRCGSDTKEGWTYCPKCGNPLRRRDLFSDMFDRMRREMKEMDRVFEKDMQFFDISPFFRQQKPRGSGFTIRITRAGGKEPRVSVKTFGNVDNNVKRELSEELEEMGVSKQPKPEKREHKEGFLREMIPAGGPAEPIREAPKKDELEKVCEPRSTEEPECEVRPLEDRVVVEIKLPGVKEDDIRIKELESSVEVKAMVKDKAYFKILTKPENRRIAGKSFRNGVLRIELQ
jgi:HSP20 family molecular chaperone IbpA